MKCKQVENVLPLFVADDLEDGRAAEVRTHLAACVQCRRRAAEFAESRNWLTASPPPEFNEAFFADLRAAVRDEIAHVAAPPQWRQWFALHWAWQPLAAAACVLLLLVGAALFLKFKHTKGEPQNDIVHTDKSPAQDKPQTKDRIIAKKVKSRTSGRRRSDHRPAIKAIEPLNEPINNAPDETPVAAEDAVLDTSEMLRIELQTADPNIRIIWFAPKQTETNTR